MQAKWGPLFQAPGPYTMNAWEPMRVAGAALHTPPQSQLLICNRVWARALPNHPPATSTSHL